MSPLPANDHAPGAFTVEQAHAMAADLRRQIDALERDAAFGPAVQALAAETAEACRFPTDHEEG